MPPDASSPQAVLDAWRAQHSDRMDPVRFHFIQALSNRAQSIGGQARAQLDARLSGLISTYAADLASAASTEPAPARAPRRSCAVSSKATARTFAELLQHAERTKPSNGVSVTPPIANAADAEPPDLPALDEFRQLWSQVRTDSQLRQSLEQLPTDAGPLNSGTLVHRAMVLMREHSPGYLQHFMAYLDVLTGLEQLQHGGALEAAEAPLTESPSRRPRKPRARRG